MSARTLIAILITLLFSVLTVTHVDFFQLGARIAAVDGFRWALAAPLFALAHVLRGWRWSAAVNAVKKTPSGPVVAYSIIGMWINDLIPARVGELYRAILLRNRHDIPLASGLGTVVVERALDGLMTVGLLVVASLFIPIDEPGIVAARLAGMVGFGAAAAAVVLAAIAPQALRRQILWVAQPLPKRWRKKLATLLDDGLAGIAIVRRPLVMLALVFRTLLVWTALVLFYWLMFPAMDVHAGPVTAILVLSVASLSTALPSAPGYIGVYHFAAKSALMLVGTDPEHALGYAIIMHATEVGITLLLGAGLLLKLGVHLPRRDMLTAKDGENA